MFDAILTVFQIITLDNWSQMMYNMAYNDSFWLASLFCSAIVFIGSFFMLNLMLAVIMDSYDQCQNSLDVELKATMEAEKNEIEKRI